LKGHPFNPRKLSKKAHADLLKSFKELGYVETIVINEDNTIIAGHQRYKIMMLLGWQNSSVDCRVPPRQLTDEEADKYLIRSNKVVGEWDDDLLANHFSEELLLDCGFTREELGMDNEESEEIEGIDPEEKLVIEITCKHETEQRELYEEFENRGLICRLLTL